MTFKVPFRSDAQIESAVQELLRQYAKAKGEPPRPPIPVDAIAESVLGLTLEMGDLRKKLGKPDVLGATWLDDALVVIDSSLEGNEGRQPFGWPTVHTHRDGTVERNDRRLAQLEEPIVATQDATPVGS